ncbi:ubiquitin-specific protease doa4 [Rhodotorula mucilaginosa]|uniref:ubiquitinyl hydrolase 1 n=1 Tax=Rhodotorula mucilaginosa TaxID=5537 RepID=A0A9P6W8E9_RHOMI|nr:ubiquitin-specific protease doa4 [Rhodotorula mucilaginosa]
MRLSAPGPGESLPAPWSCAYEAPAPAPFGRSTTRSLASGSLHGKRATHNRDSVSGLVNTGNSCYLASIVQVLLATPPLEKFFLDDDYLREINTANRLGSGGELAETFAELCKVAASGEFRSLSPAYLQEALARWAPQYSDETQQDAHECLLSLLDGLHEDLNLILRPPPPIETSPARETALQQLPEVVAADMVWKEYRDRQDSVIAKSATAWSACDAILNARRRVPTDLQDCIADYLQEEILRDDNAWRCPTCKSPQVASKRVSIARLPQFLVIHLERFAYNARKITTPISFPLSGLELGGLLPPMALAYPSPYELHVPHEPGTSYEFAEGLSEEERWIEIDDETVTPLETADGLDDALLRAEETAYLLFYRISDLLPLRD